MNLIKVVKEIDPKAVFCFHVDAFLPILVP